MKWAHLPICWLDSDQPRSAKRSRRVELNTESSLSVSIRTSYMESEDRRAEFQTGPSARHWAVKVTFISITSTFKHPFSASVNRCANAVQLFQCHCFLSVCFPAGESVGVRGRKRTNIDTRWECVDTKAASWNLSVSQRSRQRSPSLHSD